METSFSNTRRSMDVCSRKGGARVLPVTKEHCRTRAISDQPVLSSKTRTMDGFRTANRPKLVSEKPKSRRTIFLRIRRYIFAKTSPFLRVLERIRLRIEKRIPKELFTRYRRILSSIALSPRQAFYASLVFGLAFGVLSTAAAFQIFDRGANASTDVPVPVAQDPVKTELASVVPEEYDPEGDVFLEYFKESAKEEYENNIHELVKGYPIEPMLPYIFEKDRTVAAFLIGIAKKESNWGKRVPVLEGQDCFNYWGYRGVRRLMGTGGHTCFNSRKDAVDTVARRIEKLVYSEKLNTPAKMILWKCGFSCAGHSRESVKKWIADVDMYFQELNEEE